MIYEGLRRGKFHIHSSDWDTAQPHKHHHLEFMFVVRGSIEHHIYGRTDRIDSGGYFFIDHKTMHSYERVSAEPLYITNFLFYPEFLDRTLASKHSFEDIMNSYILKFSYKTLKEPVVGKPFYDKTGIIRSAVEEIVQEFENKNYGYLELIRSLFVKILIMTMREIGKSDNIHERNKIINEITDCVNKRYSEKLRLNDIAKELNYSVGYISSLFSKETGMNFSKYLQQIRIEQACKLLENTNMSVLEISQAVGISDIKFFNRIFKEQLGISPSKFRKLHI